jgi:energy-coupling factor transporter ATP-binding protein EcfA2
VNTLDTVASTNPFPGLRPFHQDEEHLFFGREMQVDAMIDKLAETHFLAVVGASGSGKSSLVNCGLRPALHRGCMLKAGTVWRIAQFRPGSNPIRAMAEALARDGVLYQGFKSEDFSLAEIIESGLRTSKLGLVTMYEQARLGADVNLLVVADQFEELFRYHKVGASGSEIPCGLGEEAKAFVNLLLEVCEHKSPVYVVLTMRSDFLGDCAHFFGLPEAINKGQYLVPRMSRDERRLAIEGPIGVGGAQIDPALATRLVNDVGDNPDQLSILQHALNRTWARWENDDGRQGPLELKHYESIGTMAHALDQHAERAFTELDTGRKQTICETIMKALTDWGTDARGTRRPTKLGTLCALAEATEAETIQVIDVFRKPSRSFLMPPAQETLHEETVIDISHESLMRVWERLKTWGEEEARSAQMYRRLRDWAVRWDKGDAGLWRGPDLASAIAWRGRQAPSPRWAERYGGWDDLELAMRFLDASEQSQRAEIAAEETKRQRQLRRARRWACGSGVVTLILMLGILGYCAAFRWNYDAYFNSYVKVFGVPRGIGPLSADQISHRNLSYKITTKGWYGLVARMEAVNAMGQFTTGGMATGFESSSGETSKSEVRWDYVYDGDGRVAYEVSLDRNGRRLRSVVYSPADHKTPNSRNAYMIGKSGSMAPQVGSCAAFLKFEYSKDGYERRTHYLDQMGNPTAGKDGVSMLQRDFDRQGREIRLLSLWKDGQPMNDKVGNAEARYLNDDLGNIIAAEAFDAAGAPVNLKTRARDWQRLTLKYDVHGNPVEQVFWKADGSPGIGEDGCHRIRYTYDERGKIVRSDCLDQHGQAAVTNGGGYAAAWEIHYDDKGRRTEWKFFDKDRQPGTGPEGAFRVAVGYDTDDNVTSVAYFSADGQPTVGGSGFHKQISTFESGREVRTQLVGVDGKPAALDAGYVAIERRYDSRGNEEQLAYIGAGGHPVRNKHEGFAIKRALFDACGRETETRYLDENAKPIRLNDGYAVVKKVYDDGSNVVEETYLDESEQRVRSVDGYAHVARKFDRHKNIVEERYVDEHGKAFLMKGSYAKRIRRYNDHNHLIDEAYFDASGKPVLNDQGWARITYVRNIDGENIETAYFGTNGKPLKLEKRYAKTISRHNDRNAVVEEAYLGAKGEPVPKNETVYFGPDGKPVRSEKGYAKLIRRYDDRNALIEEAYFGVSGEPVLNDQGWARITYVNNARGRAIERVHFGVRGEPVIGKSERYHRTNEKIC